MSGGDMVCACGKADEKLVVNKRRNELLAGDDGTVKCERIASVAAISGMSGVSEGSCATMAARPTRCAVVWRRRRRKRVTSSIEAVDAGEAIVEVGGRRGDCWAGCRDGEETGDWRTSWGVSCSDGVWTVSGMAEAEPRILESSGVGDAGVAGGGGGGERQTRRTGEDWWLDRWISANRGLCRTTWQMSQVSEKRSWSECSAGMKPLKLSAIPQMLQMYRGYGM